MAATGLRARKKRETRLALIEAAVSLTEQRGVDAVTVADIAAAADVSRRTFFNYFSSKEEAIVGSDPERTRRLAELLAARPAHEPVWTAMRGALADFYAEGHEPERAWLRRLRMVRGNPSLVGQMRAEFARIEQALGEVVAARTGAAPDDLATRLVVSTAVTAIRVAMDDWLARPTSAPLATSVDEALALLADGLGAREAASARGA